MFLVITGLHHTCDMIKTSLLANTGWSKKIPDFHDLISKNQPGFQPQKTAQSLINQGSALFFSHNSLAASIVYSRQSGGGLRHFDANLWSENPVSTGFFTLSDMPLARAAPRRKTRRRFLRWDQRSFGPSRGTKLWEWKILYQQDFSLFPRYSSAAFPF